jgi:hypothetical protein
VVTLQVDGEAVPVGSTDIGSFEHENSVDPLGATVNHVVWHHVRDALYAIGEENMQTITLNFASVQGITVSPRSVSLAVLATQQLTPTLIPVAPTIDAVTYASSDVTKATVSETGLITAVEVTTEPVVITVTTEDGGFTATCAVTVTAP